MWPPKGSHVGETACVPPATLLPPHGPQWLQTSVSRWRSAECHPDNQVNLSFLNEGFTQKRYCISVTSPVKSICPGMTDGPLSLDGRTDRHIYIGIVTVAIVQICSSFLCLSDLIDVQDRTQTEEEGERRRRGPPTRSGGAMSGPRLWLARVMHSSSVLMKVEQVALSRDACKPTHTGCVPITARTGCDKSSQSPPFDLFLYSISWSDQCNNVSYIYI